MIKQQRNPHIITQTSSQGDGEEEVVQWQELLRGAHQYFGAEQDRNHHQRKRRKGMVLSLVLEISHQLILLKVYTLAAKSLTHAILEPNALKPSTVSKCSALKCVTPKWVERYKILLPFLFLLFSFVFLFVFLFYSTKNIRILLPLLRRTKTKIRC